MWVGDANPSQLGLLPIWITCLCLRLHYNTRLFPDPRVLLFVLQNVAGYENDIKCGWMSASMKWRHLCHLQLSLRAVATMAEMEVSPQEGMANPQGMEVFAVERPGLPGESMSVPALCGVPYCAESADCLGSATVVGTGRVSMLQVHVLLS